MEKRKRFVLTERNVYKYGLELWRWLQKHPDKSKQDWPKWKMNGGPIPDVNGGCFACEYAEGHKKGCKDGCLLIELWPKTCLFLGGSVFTEYNDYKSYGFKEGIVKAAKTIADFHGKKLKEYDERKVADNEP